MSRPERNRKLSRKDEQRLLQAGKRVLLVGFPNPDRIGCPGSETLKAIAFRKLDLPRSSQYIDHFGECSPCFSEYIAFREQAQRTKRVRLTAGCCNSGLHYLCSRLDVGPSHAIER